MHAISSSPWVVLERAYRAKGELAKAEGARQEWMRIRRERGEQL